MLLRRVASGCGKPTKEICRGYIKIRISTFHLASTGQAQRLPPYPIPVLPSKEGPFGITSAAQYSKQLGIDVGRPGLGDQARLQQVIWNLLSNAVKFTPAGGRVEVRLDRQGGDVVIAVKDTGIGIDPVFAPPPVRALPAGRLVLDPRPRRAGDGAGPGAPPGRGARRERCAPTARAADVAPRFTVRLPAAAPRRPITVARRPRLPPTAAWPLAGPGAAAGAGGRRRPRLARGGAGGAGAGRRAGGDGRRRRRRRCRSIVRAPAGRAALRPGHARGGRLPAHAAGARARPVVGRAGAGRRPDRVHAGRGPARRARRRGSRATWRSPSIPRSWRRRWRGWRDGCIDGAAIRPRRA